MYMIDELSYPLSEERQWVFFDSTHNICLECVRWPAFLLRVKDKYKKKRKANPLSLQFDIPFAPTTITYHYTFISCPRLCKLNVHLYLCMCLCVCVC